MGLNGIHQVNIQMRQIYDADLTFPRDMLSRPYTTNFTDGTDDGQVNLQFHDERTVAGVTADDLDLYGGLTDTAGRTLQFSAIKVFFIYNTESSGGPDLLVGDKTGVVANAWNAPWDNGNGANRVHPGMKFDLCTPYDGYAVTDGVADIIRIYNTHLADACTYEIIIEGVGTTT